MEKVKGFEDYTGEEAEKREFVIEVIRDIFKRYGFQPAETPVIEYENFVKGENSNDDAVRDIFKLKDRGNRNLALRYEFTFQLKRISKGKKLPYKRYQIGYVFRDEPIREGRKRQFIQCDADIIGSTIKDEAENFCMLKDIFSELGISYKIYFNNRKLINEILEKNGADKNRDCIIREIDKLDKLSKKEVRENLKKFNAGFLVDELTKTEKYYEKYNSYKEIQELKKHSKLFDCEIEFRPFLARGLSYYTGTIFEVWSEKLNVSICGGGTYYVNGIESTGVSLGLEPIMLIFDKKINKEDYLILSINRDKEAIEIAKKLRNKGKIVSIYYGKPSKALEYANSYNIKKVIFVGDSEIKEKKLKIRDMKTGKESYIEIDKLA